MKSKVEISLKKDSFAAGAEVAKICGKEANKINFVFNSPVYDAAKFIEGFETVADSKNLIGFSTPAVLSKEGCVLNEEGFSALMSIDDEELTVGIAALSKEDSARETGRKVAKLALEEAEAEIAPDYFFMAATDEEEMYIKGIQDVIGRVPCFGASPLKGEGYHLYCKKQVVDNGVAVAFFYTEKQINTKFSGMFNETKKVGVITLVSDNRLLVEINNQPALDVYAKMLGKTKEEIKGHIKDNYLFNPLGVKDRLGDLVAIRNVEEEKEDGSLLMGANLSENTALILMEKNKDEIVNDTETIIKYLKATVAAAAAYLMFNNVERSFKIEDQRDELHKKVKALVEDAGFLMPVCQREYGYADDQTNTVGNLMMSFTVFEK